MAALPPRPLARLRRALALATVLLATVSASAVPVAAEEGTTVAPAAVPATLSVTGHGWGHGRGMGQYGAFGYATGRSGGPWDHATILNHYYGGTTVGHINANPLMAVLLKARANQAMVVYRAAGLQVPGIAGTPTAIRATLRPDGRFDVQTGTACNNTGSTPKVQVSGPVRVKAAPGSGTTALRLCRGDGSQIAYRGELVAFGRSFDGSQVGAQTVNLVNMDELMRGVVPRESPASWGDADGGRGMAALRAQAVAARSYAASGDTRWGDLHSGLGARATTCDDQFCQVYGGAASVSPAGAITTLTDPRTDRAVAETAGEVRLRAGAVARTEFSSSTGGWTAGGAFPAVVDQGDAVANNPNHTWTTTVARSTIESAYGLGTLTGIQVLQRNGLGAMGGRVLGIRLTGTTRAVDVTGSQLRSALGLKSDWFTISAPPPPAVPPRSIDAACPANVPRGTFSDVPASSVHARAVDCVAWRDIAEGDGAGHFFPNGTVTRAQMASFVARLITAGGGSLPAAPADAFTDDQGLPHEHSINQLAALRIVRGVGPSSYAPNVPVDRAQLASILGRALVHLGVTLASTPADAFVDDAGSVHALVINQLAAEGVVTGTSSGRYQPNATAFRDQMASTLARALDLALVG